ncbi:hypothetical protein EMCG_05232 [[Emmonsia] crescens]|uniref:Uncharacterized protein n=1 Tax=[Emmonsia] crescens TaxID=73230 RepID=A0A0G2J6D7_9EURO|nr:hypothetical protein EMCG_05232 [Emmonsia crescens UAMH 3008]
MPIKERPRSIILHGLQTEHYLYIDYSYNFVQAITPRSGKGLKGQEARARLAERIWWKLPMTVGRFPSGETRATSSVVEAVEYMWLSPSLSNLRHIKIFEAGRGGSLRFCQNLSRLAGIAPIKSMFSISNPGFTYKKTIQSQSSLNPRPG